VSASKPTLGGRDLRGWRLVRCGGCGLACRAGEICRRGTCARFDSIGAGETHTCAVNGGAVWCWGRNNDGRIGDASVALRDRPTRVTLPISGPSYVAVGRSHACAWTSGGAIACWGRNDHRQLGVSTAGPAIVPGVAVVSSAAVGRDFTCVANGDGEVLCWGKNDLGQCGVAAGAEQRQRRAAHGGDQVQRAGVVAHREIRPPRQSGQHLGRAAVAGQLNGAGCCGADRGGGQGDGCKARQALGEHEGPDAQADPETHPQEANRRPGHEELQHEHPALLAQTGEQLQES
jgi:hypothetical protein